MNEVLLDRSRPDVETLQATIITHGGALPGAEQRAANLAACVEPKVGNLSAADIAFMDPGHEVPIRDRSSSRYEVACRWLCPLAGKAACWLSDATQDTDDARKACVTELYL